MHHVAHGKLFVFCKFNFGRFDVKRSVKLSVFIWILQW